MQLKNYVPFFIADIKEFNEIYAAEDKELNKIKLDIKDLKAQCFVNTATWGLKYWEELLNIPVDLTKNIEYRRSTIIAKLRGQGTTTVKMIKNVAESFSNGEVEVIEDNKNYRFIIKFVGTKGVPPNMSDLENAIEEIKPAHLSYVFEYMFTLWKDLKENYLSWDDVGYTTWEKIRTLKL